MNKYFLVIVFIPFLLACGSTKMGSNNEAQKAELERIANEEFSNSDGILLADVEEKPVFTFKFEEYDGSFSHYLGKTVKPPSKFFEEGVSGELIVGFIVDEEGAVNDAWVISSLSPTIDREVLRAVKSSPKWTPGMHEGEAVKVKHTVPYQITMLGVRREVRQVGYRTIRVDGTGRALDNERGFDRERSRSSSNAFPNGRTSW
jgi:protein TonB